MNLNEQINALLNAKAGEPTDQPSEIPNGNPTENLPGDSQPTSTPSDTEPTSQPEPEPTDTDNPEGQEGSENPEGGEDDQDDENEGSEKPTPEDVDPEENPTPEEAAQELDAITEKNGGADPEDDSDDDGLDSAGPDLGNDDPESDPVNEDEDDDGGDPPTDDDPSQNDGQSESGDDTLNEDGSISEAEDEADESLDDVSNDVDHAQDSIDKAKEVSDNLARLARMMTDLFPEGNETARKSPNYGIMMRMAQVGMESIREQTQALVGDEVNLTEDDPLVLVARKTLASISQSFQEAERLLGDASDYRDRLIVIKDQQLKAGDVATSQVSPKILRNLGINGMLTYSSLTASLFYGRQEQALRYWLRNDFSQFLKDIVVGKDTVIPSSPPTPDVRGYDDDTTRRIVEHCETIPGPHSQLLPGNWVLAMITPKDRTEGRVGFVRLEDTDGTQATNSPLTSSDRDRLITEASSMLAIMDQLRLDVSFVTRVASALTEWTQDANVEEVEALGLPQLYDTIRLICQTAARASYYTNGLFDLLESRI